MSLSAFTNKEGWYNRSVSLPVYYHRSDKPSENFDREETHVVESSLKSMTQKNPYFVIPGTSTLWRGSGNYTRGVWKVEQGSHRAYVDYPGDRYDDYLMTKLGRIGNGPATMYMGTVFSHTRPEPDFDTNDRNRARTECLMKLGDQKASLGAAFVEAGKTVEMISSNAIQAANALRHFKRGDFRGAAKALGVDGKSIGTGSAIANRWLEFVYGWKPLASDIYDGVELLKLQLADAQLLTARRTVRDTQTVDHWVNNFVHVEGKVETKHVCSITATIDNTYRRAANQAGLYDPLGIAWELVPYSFLVDWVLPVGNMLEALSATAGLQFVSGYESVRAQGKTVRLVPGAPHPNYHDECRSTMDRFGFRRVAFSGFPAPLPYIKSPFSWGHAANAAALIRGLL